MVRDEIPGFGMTRMIKSNTMLDAVSQRASWKRFHRELGRSGYAVIEATDYTMHYYRVTRTDNGVLSTPVGKGNGSDPISALVDGCPANVGLTTKMALLECQIEEITPWIR